MEALPVIIRELDDDAAIILMVDSNLQRESLLPSEKAFAYKLKLEAMKRQGARTDLTSTPAVSKSRTNEIVGQDYGDSREQVRRYIRLTELTPELLQLVDDKSIVLRPAVELSYLPKEQQELVYKVIDRDITYPSLNQAQRLRKYCEQGKLDENVITVILNEEKPLERKVTFDGEWVQKRFPKGMTQQQIKERINKALDLLERTERRRQQEYSR